MFHRCKEFFPCVECQAFNSGVFNQNCSTQCTTFNTTIVQQFDEESNDVKVCRIIDEMGCTITFQYKYNDDKNPLVAVHKDKECKEPVNVIGMDTLHQIN